MIKQNILVVDDHQENLVALEAILESPHRHLVMATSGNEALQMALKHDFSLILLDVQMPEMDGFEVAHLLRKNRRTSNIPIIFVTAISKEERYVFKGYECGAVDYLFKPIDQQILEAKVNVFLELDLQKRKLQQAVVQMKRLKDQNERLLQALGEGVIGTDEKGVISFCNDAACALLSTSRERLQGLNVEDVLFHDSKGNRRWSWKASPLLEACSRGESWQNQHPLHARIDEHVVMVEMTASPVNREGDAFSGTVILFRDVSGRELPDEELRAREQRRFRRKKIFREMVVFDRSTGGNVGRLLNISEDGFKLFMRHEGNEGQELPLSMVLPEPIKGVNTLSFDARLIWWNRLDSPGEYHAGFQFTELSPTARGIIEVLIDKY